MARLFISYSRSDETFARQLAASLSNLGADVWIDIEDIPAGMNWSNAIQQGLDVSDVLLVVISPDSMASSNVADEWQYYFDQRKAVIPVLLRPAKVHFQLSRLQYIDFHHQGYDRALRQLHAELSRKGATLEPLPSAPAAVPPQSPLPVETGSLPTSVQPMMRRALPLALLMLGLVIILGIGIVAFMGSRVNPTPTPDSNSSTNDGASTSTPFLSRTPTLSATDLEATINAQMLSIPTEAAQTQAAVQTMTATFWTPTPAPDTRATAVAKLTETQITAIAAATQAFFAAQTQAALDLTATATLWSPTPTATYTPSNTPTPSDTPTPTLSPTPTPEGGSNLLAFASLVNGRTAQITLMDMTGIGGQFMNPGLSEAFPAWSPDGQTILYAASDGLNIRAHDRPSSRLLANLPNLFEEDAAWSPDGSQIAFATSPSDKSKRDLYVINADGTGLRQLTASDAEDRHPTWSPDGQQIAFHTDRNGRFAIYLLDAACATPTDCENSARSIKPNGLELGSWPDWSPVGDQIVFQSDRDGDFDLYIINADGSNLRQLINEPGNDRRPDWSPDGQWLAFQSDLGIDEEIFMVDITGESLRRLTDNEYDDTNPDWRPIPG